MTLTIKLDGNWNSFQLANNTPPLSVTGSVIAPSARMDVCAGPGMYKRRLKSTACLMQFAFHGVSKDIQYGGCALDVRTIA